jgi:hypothetical protein
MDQGLSPFGDSARPRYSLVLRPMVLRYLFLYLWLMSVLMLIESCRAISAGALRKRVEAMTQLIAELHNLRRMVLAAEARVPTTRRKKPRDRRRATRVVSRPLARSGLRGQLL